jgi:predicted SAM-dependent methyltransferase
MKRLNIGCGNIPLKNFTNTDKCYYPGTENPNVNKKLAETWNQDHPESPWLYGDATDIHYPDNTFDEVIAVHVIEHMSMNDGNQCIAKMYKILKPGGTVEIEVPDLLKACKLAQEVHINSEGNNQQWFRVMGLFNGTTGDDGEGQYHLCMYTQEYLRYRLAEHGFFNIEEIAVGFGHGRPEPQYNFRLRAKK